MKNKIIIAIFSLLLFLSGCSTAPKTATVFNEDVLKKPDSEHAVLVIYRKLNAPTAFKVKVLLDENEFTSFPNEAFASIKVSPGRHVLRTKWPMMAMMLGNKTTINAEAERYYFIKLDSNMGVFLVGGMATTTFGTNIEQITYTKAIDELMQCCRSID